jgi:hypothetical protein
MLFRTSVESFSRFDFSSVVAAAGVRGNDVPVVDFAYGHQEENQKTPS